MLVDVLDDEEATVGVTILDGRPPVEPTYGEYVLLEVSNI